MDHVGLVELAQWLLLLQGLLYFVRIPVLRLTEPEKALGFGAFFTVFIGVAFLVQRALLVRVAGPWPWRILLAFEVGSVCINLGLLVTRLPRLHAALCVTIAGLAAAILVLLVRAGPPMLA